MATCATVPLVMQLDLRPWHGPLVAPSGGTEQLEEEDGAGDKSEQKRENVRVKTSSPLSLSSATGLLYAINCATDSPLPPPPPLGPSNDKRSCQDEHEHTFECALELARSLDD